MLLNKQHNPIGLDLGARAFKAAQRDRTGRITAQLVLPRRDTAPEALPEELDRLVGVMSRRGFVGRSVVTTCPPDRVITEPLKLPPADSGAPLAELTAAEIARTRQLQPGTFEVGAWPIPTPARGGEGSYVMASAALHADTEHLLSLMDDTGLDVMAIDTPALALARGATVGRPALQGMTLLIDLGWDAARVVVLHSGAVVFERSNDEAGLKHLYQSGGEQLTLDGPALDQLFSKHGMTPARADEPEQDPAWRGVLNTCANLSAAHFETVARELAKSTAYVNHRYPDAPLQQAILTGGGASLPGVSAYLGSALCVQVTADNDPDRALLTAAIGLAAHPGQAQGVAA